ncbi:hypoxanthine phosphoribosyltransferase [Planctomicrobium piriforme]|uniref:Hypoxanthine phosphoribosyltransferase n=1 Tax=Planctomicrobium piriforme TaxID=1576369 RepID=A0A1I3FFJ3_9PLAN|nr:hypoxanthine phosphoribosyltransferase [Planctomicrobium piriforme]SFI09964.1 hypoxanthine phosphoribosyltransferase [Planctomicrobium piriforme]
MDQVRVLIPQETISDAVQQLGRRITEDYQGHNLTVLGVLTGSIVLVTDLMRQIALPHQLGLVQASSYRGTATTPGELTINLDFLPDIRGRDILLVDDIFDTGRTLSAIHAQLQQFQPRTVRSAVLLWKTARRTVEATPDYYCFEIPDEFVVGYGLDYNHQFRHLPYIGVLEL